jgi:predicted enzyme related to lactoylglutathione lyase
MEDQRVSKEKKRLTGMISWVDLTVGDAEGIREFYREVVGWEPEAVSMGEYDDYAMSPPAGEAPVAGICHARGPNTNLPPQWLIYIVVEDMERSIDRSVALGGKLLAGPTSMGEQGSICVIQDPAGAVAALYQHGD